MAVGGHASCFFEKAPGESRELVFLGRNQHNQQIFLASLYTRPSETSGYSGVRGSPHQLLLVGQPTRLPAAFSLFFLVCKHK
jgi:hypothetical protein